MGVQKRRTGYQKMRFRTHFTMNCDVSGRSCEAFEWTQLLLLLCHSSVRMKRSASSALKEEDKGYKEEAWSLKDVTFVKEGRLHDIGKVIMVT